MITENKFGQIFEVLTPPQGYVMDKTFVCFNKRGLTVSPLDLKPLKIADAVFRISTMTNSFKYSQRVPPLQ
jgi:hypothetical protein